MTSTTETLCYNEHHLFPMMNFAVNFSVDPMMLIIVSLNRNLNHKSINLVSDSQYHQIRLADITVVVTTGLHIHGNTCDTVQLQCVDKHFVIKVHATPAKFVLV